MAPPRRRPPARPPPRVVPVEEMLKSLHDILYTEVGRAVEPVANLEKNWAQGEMVKRIVRYIYKAAGHEEIFTLGWEEGVKKFITGAMQSYSASCQEKEWFYELDLVPVFQRAAWEVLTAHPSKHGAGYREVEEIAEIEYQSYLDETLNNKAMWIAVAHVFTDSKHQTKVFTALQRTYQVALDYVLADTRPLEDLQRLEIFLKKWMEDSLTRAWNSVCQAGEERTLTEETALKLFRKLMAPFGVNHPFSCVPLVLVERIGRPPEKWPFIANTIRGIFRSWSQQQALGAASKKKRRKGGGAEEPLEDVPAADEEAAPEQFIDEMPEEQEEEELAAPEEGEEGELLEGEEEAAPEGHPECTSQEDCQGTQDDVLIRHMLNGRPGDLYCKTCWTSFLEQNPNLEGEEEG